MIAHKIMAGEKKQGGLGVTDLQTKKGALRIKMVCKGRLQSAAVPRLRCHTAPASLHPRGLVCVVKHTATYSA